MIVARDEGVNASFTILESSPGLSCHVIHTLLLYTYDFVDGGVAVDGYNREE